MTLNSHPFRSLAVFAVAALALSLISADNSVEAGKGGSSSQLESNAGPLRVVAELPENRGIRVGVEAQRFSALEINERIAVALPISKTEALSLELERFNVISPTAKFIVAGADGEREMAAPNVTFLRGHIADEMDSYAYLALSESGAGNGYVTTASGQKYMISTQPEDAASGASEFVVSQSQDTRFDPLPEGVTFCGIGENPELFDERGNSDGGDVTNRRGAVIPGGPKLARVAIDADQHYVQMFGNDTNVTAAYILELMGAISDIYERDVDTRLEVERIRMFYNTPTPYSNDNVGQLRNWWLANEDTTGLNYVHLFSGRRDLSFGGIAFISNACISNSYAISGYLNGAFSAPLEDQSLDNWDVTVVAHEMGHNSGTGHTHDDFTPQIDSCAQNVPTQGTIMSYCHIHTGYLTRLDVRFHRLVQEKMQTEMDFGGCLIKDCNGNGIDDALDISGGAPDVNFDGIPDECQDCNNNGILDPDDITGGMPDVDGNGIPDECEPDCDGDNFPDEWAIANSVVFDDNGNNVPDACDPDCEPDGVPDWLAILNGWTQDDDRNGVPDECQDCNSNTISDVLELLYGNDIFVGDLNGKLRHYNQRSGWPVEQYSIPKSMGVTVGADRNVYVANDFSGGGEAVYQVNPGAPPSPFVTVAASGGMSAPTDIEFGSDGALYVLDRNNAGVWRFDGSTGAFVDVFVTAGSGGLSGPRAMTWGPNGNLFVASADNRVLEFDSADGSYISDFVGVANCCDVPGDADGSGSFSIGDITYLIAYIFSGGLAPACFIEGDADGNGDITIADVTYGIAHIFAGGPAPTCPPSQDNGGLDDPRGLVFMSSGDLLVTSFAGNEILRFDGTTGAFLEVFSDEQYLGQPWGITEGPNGNIFVVRHASTQRVIEYVPEGRYHRYYIRNEIDTDFPTDLVFLPPGPFDLDGNNILDACE